MLFEVVATGGVHGGRQSTPQLLDDSRLARLRAVGLKTESGEPQLRKPLVDDVEGRHLGTDEEHLQATPERVRDEVRDRLALAGPGWPVDDQVLTVPCKQERRKLA